MFFCEFCEISKNTFSYRTPPAAASDDERLDICKTSVLTLVWSIFSVTDDTIMFI